MRTWPGAVTPRPVLHDGLWEPIVTIQSTILLLALLQQSIQPISPDDHAKLAAAFLSDTNKIISQADKRYVRFLSFYNYAGSPDVESRQRMLRFFINNLHLESDVEFPREVPGSSGLLYWIDLRDYGWTAAAWATVAQRDPYFRQPAISAGPAQFIRVVIGAQQDPKTLHAVGIVRADWFMRETSELDRSQSYYDLLYAKQRHPDGGTETYEEEKTIDWPGGYSEYSKAVVPAGRYVIKETKTRAKGSAANPGFPANERDVEKLLGVADTRKFIRESGINLQHGAVVEGGEKGVSIVARQNRLLERTQGPIGYWWKTFDVKETSGKRDFAETLQKDFEFDAGEILFKLPGGGQGGLLVDSAGKVLNVADNRFAIDHSDSKDVRVRNYTSCIVCHESGIISPSNLIQQMMESGIDIKFKDKKEARDARSFFLGWGAKLKADQDEHAEFLKRTSGYSPAENSVKWKRARDAYDAPVDMATAAAECGVSVQALRGVAARSVKARILNLVQGISMPRRTWETNGYEECQKLLHIGGSK